MRKPKSENKNEEKDKGDKHQRYARSYLPNSFKYMLEECATAYVCVRIQ